MTMRKIALAVLSAAVLASCVLQEDDSQDSQSESITSLEFTEESVEIDEGKAKTLYVRFTPSGAAAGVQYSSAVNGIVNISGQSDKGCVITGISAGGTIITASAQGYTAYCEVKVVNGNVYSDPYIVLPYLTMEMKRGSRKTVIASLYGGTASDNAGFVWTSDSSCVSIDPVSNQCIIEAVKNGSAVIKVHNDKAAVDAYFNVYVMTDSDPVFYLSTKNNVVKIKSGTDSAGEINTVITGGSESDYANIIYTVTEGSDCLSVVSNNGKCTLNGRKSGNALLEISHSKADKKLYVQVVVSDEKIITHIETDNDFLVLSSLDEAVVNAYLVGNDAADASEKYSCRTEDPSVISVSHVNDAFYIKALKNGYSKIYISNSYTDIVKEVQIVVNALNIINTENYITTGKNVIYMEKGDEDTPLEMKLVGGNESDKNSFSWSVGDSSLVSVTTNDGKVTYERSAAAKAAETYNAVCYITAKECGETYISVTHPKTDINARVKVIVYPKGTLAGRQNVIRYDGIIKVVKGKTAECSLTLEYGSIDSLQDIIWKIEDEGIAKATYAKLNGVVAGISSGITNLNVSSASLEHDVSIPVVCSDTDDFSAISCFYLNSSFTEIEKGNSAYIEINKNGTVDITKYVLSNNDSSVCYARVLENVICINGIKSGRTVLTLTNASVPGIKCSLEVKVTDSSVTISKPYSIKSESYIGLVKNTEKEIAVELQNAPESEYQNISWKSAGSEVQIVSVNGNKAVVKAVGDGAVTVSHPKCAAEKTINIYTADSEEALKSKEVLYIEKTNYSLNIGSYLYLKINKTGSGTISYSINDVSLAQIETDGDNLVVKGIAPGSVIITAKTENSLPLNIYVTVLEEGKSIYDKTIVLPSVVELLTGQSTVISAGVSGLSSDEVAEIEWKYTAENCAVTGNAEKCCVKALKKGCSEITVKDSRINYEKNIIVVVCDSAEEFKTCYVLNAQKNLYRIKKGDLLSVKLLSGTYSLPEAYYETIKWSAENNSVIELSGNGMSADICGLNAGTSEITVSSDKVENTVRIKIEVTEDYTGDSDFYFTADSIVQVVKGETVEKTFAIKSSSNGEIKNYDDVEILNKSLANEVALAGNKLRIKGKVAGQEKITLYYPLVKLQKTILVSVVESSAQLAEDYPVYIDKTNMLLKTGAEGKAYISTVDNSIERMKSLVWSVKDDSVASVDSSAGNIIAVKALKEGNTEISTVCSNKEYKIYVSVEDDYEEDVSIITESIISIYVGQTYRTKAISNKTVVFSETNGSGAIEITDNNDNTADIKGLAKGVSEIVVSYDNEYRKIVVSVAENESAAAEFKGMNVAKRYYKISKNTTLKISPVFYPAEADRNDTVYTDKTGNNVCSITNIQGEASITGINAGIQEYAVSNKDFYSFSVYVEVSDSDSYTQKTEQEYYLTAEKTSVSINPLSKNNMIIVNVLGSGNFLGSGSYVWSVDRTDLFDITYNGQYCYVTPKASSGKGMLTCSNNYCSNYISIKLDIGSSEKDSSETVKYIYVEKNSYTMSLFDSPVVFIPVLVNMSGSKPEDIVIKQTSGCAVAAKQVKDGVCSISLKPVSSGSGTIILSHPDASVTTNVDYVVNDDSSSKIIYLTTTQNEIVVKPDEMKTVSVQLKNYDEKDSERYEWTSSDNSVCRITGSGSAVQISGLKEGSADITVSHYKSYNKLTIAVVVSKNTVVNKYITTDRNVIETKVSKTMDSFKISSAGIENIEEYYKYTVSDSSVLSVIGNRDCCFYRGLKKGTCSVKIENTYDAEIKPISITVVVDEVAVSGKYITVDSPTFYLEPNGKTKSVSVAFNGIESYDETKLVWTVYSQEISGNKSGNVITLNAAGKKGVITSGVTGIAKVRVYYAPLDINTNIIVYVSNNESIKFAETKLSVYKNETAFALLNVPDFSDDMTGFISYKSDDESVCEIINTTIHAVCIKAVSTGTAVITAVNNYDDTQDQIAVTVLDEKDGTADRIAVLQGTYLLNPRSDNKVISASVAGTDIDESDQDNLTWSISGNESIGIYPAKGSNVVLSLKQVDGSVKEGDAVITITHEKCPAGYKKTIFVSVKEEDNFFKLDKTNVNLDVDSTEKITAAIIGADSSEYDKIKWTVDADKVEADGTVTKLARLLTTEGKTCTVLGLAGGNCTVTAFYEGTAQQCNFVIKGTRYFNLTSNALYLYPGQTYSLKYQLKPSTALATWYSSDAGSDKGSVISYTDDYASQQIVIKALKEGSVTLTGMVAGLGTVTCGIRIVYDPKLKLLTDNKTKFFIPLFDKKKEDGSANELYEKGKNSISIKFRCYPSVYYVKALTEGSYKENISCTVSQNRSENADDPAAGTGELIIEALKELPAGYDTKVKLVQYEDAECLKPTGQEQTVCIDAYYVNENSYRNGNTTEKDESVKIYFERYDGAFTGMGAFNNAAGELKEMSFNSSNGIYTMVTDSTNVEGLNWADGETHYIVVKPKHEGQILKDLKIVAMSTDNQYRKDDRKPGFVSIKPFQQDKDSYVSVIKTGDDVGVDVDRNFDIPNDYHSFDNAAPFYPYYAMRKVYWVFGNDNSVEMNKNNVFYEEINTYWSNNSGDYGFLLMGYKKGQIIRTTPIACTKWEREWGNGQAGNSYLSDTNTLIDKETFKNYQEYCYKSYSGIAYNFSYFKAPDIYTDDDGNSVSLIHLNDNFRGISFNKFYDIFYSKYNLTNYISNEVMLYKNINEFPFYFKSTRRNTNYEFNLWRNKDLLNNGYAWYLPNRDTNNIYSDTAKRAGLRITYTNIQGNSVSYEIPGKFTVYDCYRNYLCYSGGIIKVSPDCDTQCKKAGF